jgi:hypothetical protein
VDVELLNHAAFAFFRDSVVLPAPLWSLVRMARLRWTCTMMKPPPPS